MTAPVPSFDSPNDLTILSAIWILACNDENPIMTYRGLNHRLGLPVDFDCRPLVQRHGELFRLGVPQQRLDAWKATIKKSGGYPSWIRAATSVASEREALFEALTKDDVFRSQFRAEEGAPRSAIAIVEWGLEHIERLRKVGAEVREEKTKRWTSIVIPGLSLVVSLVAVAFSSVLSLRAAQDQRVLAQYEATFRPKYEGYIAFLDAVSHAMDSARSPSTPEFLRASQRASRAFLQIEPFLDSASRRSVDSLYSAVLTPGLRADASGRFSALRSQVFASLFSSPR